MVVRILPRQPTSPVSSYGEIGGATIAPLRGFFAELGVVYEGARYADRDNLLELPAYVRWDGKAGYRTRDFEVTLAAVNLTDRDYYANATGLAQIMPGTPRTFTLTAAYKF